MAAVQADAAGMGWGRRCCWCAVLALSLGFMSCLHPSFGAYGALFSVKAATAATQPEAAVHSCSMSAAPAQACGTAAVHGAAVSRGAWACAAAASLIAVKRNGSSSGRCSGHGLGSSVLLVCSISAGLMGTWLQEWFAP
jgi:hypothetical protein